MPTLDANTINGIAANRNTASMQTSHTVTTSGGNRYLVVAVCYFDGTLTISDVLWNGTSMGTALVNTGDPSTEGNIAFYGIADPDTGTNDVTFTYSGGGTLDEGAVMVSSWTDVDQTTPVPETDSDAFDRGTTDTCTVTLGTDAVMIGASYWYISGGTDLTSFSDTTLDTSNPGVDDESGCHLSYGS